VGLIMVRFLGEKYDFACAKIRNFSLVGFPKQNLDGTLAFPDHKRMRSGRLNRLLCCSLRIKLWVSIPEHGLSTP
jgi:hypothetical protein